METDRAFLGESAEKHTGHAAIDFTDFDRDQPSRPYARRAHYRVRSLKVTTLVDVKTLYVFDIHCTTTKKHDAKIGPLTVLMIESRSETIFGSIVSAG